MDHTTQYRVSMVRLCTSRFPLGGGIHCMRVCVCVLHRMKQDGLEECLGSLKYVRTYVGVFRCRLSLP